MPDWLQLTAGPSATVSWGDLAVRLVSALVLGAVVAGIYRGTRTATSVTPTFPATLVLLCVLIAMVTQVIGDNIARAFSLVGALSIVRFRTVVRDTKDTAFVIFAVVVGMAIGAEQPAVALGGIGAVGIAALLFRDRPPRSTWTSGEVLLTVRIGCSQEVEMLVTRALAGYASGVVPVSVGTVRNGAAMEITYRVRLLPTTTPTQLVAELNRLEGVQGIEIRNLPEPA